MSLQTGSATLTGAHGFSALQKLKDTNSKKTKVKGAILVCVPDLSLGSAHIFVCAEPVLPE
jgi:predicted alpha/beta hydrolase family esterase